MTNASDANAMQAAGVCDILSDDDLALLRGYYDPSQMIAAATKATVGAYPDAGGLIDFLNRNFFDTASPWQPDLREGALITLLSVHTHGEGLLLVVHYYWGLMAGLTVNQICQLLLLTGIYTGLPNFTEGVNTLKTMLIVLKQEIDKDDPARLNSLSLVATFSKVFSPTVPIGR